MAACPGREVERGAWDCGGGGWDPLSTQEEGRGPASAEGSGPTVCTQGTHQPRSQSEAGEATSADTGHRGVPGRLVT